MAGTNPNQDFPQCWMCDARDVPLRFTTTDSRGKPDGPECEECFQEQAVAVPDYAPAGPGWDDLDAANEEAGLEDAQWAEWRTTMTADRNKAEPIARTDFCRDDYRTQEEVEALARTPHDERVKARMDARDAAKAKQEGAA